MHSSQFYLLLALLQVVTAQNINEMAVAAPVVDFTDTGRMFREILTDNNTGKENSTYVDTLTPNEADDFQRSGTLPSRTLKRIESLMAKLAEITANRQNQTQAMLANEEYTNIGEAKQAMQPNRIRRAIDSLRKKIEAEEMLREQEEYVKELRDANEQLENIFKYIRAVNIPDWLMISKRRRPLVRVPSEQ